MRTLDAPLPRIIGHSPAWSAGDSTSAPSAATPSQSRGTAAPAGAAAARQSRIASVVARTIARLNTPSPRSERSRRPSLALASD
jgi:hypothetical protein